MLKKSEKPTVFALKTQNFPQINVEKSVENVEKLNIKNVCKKTFPPYKHKKEQNFPTETDFFNHTRCCITTFPHNFQQCVEKRVFYITKGNKNDKKRNKNNGFGRHLRKNRNKCSRKKFVEFKKILRLGYGGCKRRKRRPRQRTG